MDVGWWQAGLVMKINGEDCVMGKKAVVISTSLRTGSNSDALADEFARGAKGGRK